MARWSSPLKLFIDLEQEVDSEFADLVGAKDGHVYTEALLSQAPARTEISDETPFPQSTSTSMAALGTEVTSLSPATRVIGRRFQQLEVTSRPIHRSPNPVTESPERIPQQSRYFPRASTAVSTMAVAALERSPAVASPTFLGWLQEEENPLTIAEQPVHGRTPPRNIPRRTDGHLSQYTGISTQRLTTEYSPQRMHISPYQSDSGHGPLHIRTSHKEELPGLGSSGMRTALSPQIVISPHGRRLDIRPELGTAPPSRQHQASPQSSSVPVYIRQTPSLYPAPPTPSQARAGPPTPPTYRSRTSDQMTPRPATRPIDTLCQLMEQRAIRESSAIVDTGGITPPGTRSQLAGLPTVASTGTMLPTTAHISSGVPFVQWADIEERGSALRLPIAHETDTYFSMPPARQLGSHMTSYRSSGRLQETYSPDDLSCNFCKRNGERKTFYKSHNLMDRKGKIVCPILRKYVCPLCGATGDTAHTVSYCPLGRGESSVAASRTPRKSCGCNRDCKHGRTRKH